MGTWGTGVIQDDIAADILSDFFDLYNEDVELSEIRDKLEKSNKEMIEDANQGYLFWLALAKAQWDVGGLDDDILAHVEQIINSGTDSKAWKILGGTENDIINRNVSLKNFLEKIRTPKEKPRTRKRKRLVSSIFETGDVLVFKMNSGNFGAGVVLSSEKQTREGFNELVTLRKNQVTVPTLEEICAEEVTVRNMGHIYKNNKYNIAAYNFSAKTYKMFSGLFYRIGRVRVKKINKINSYANWSFMIDAAEAQFKFENINPRVQEKVSLKKYLGYLPWQKIKILECVSQSSNDAAFF